MALDYDHSLQARAREISEGFWVSYVSSHRHPRLFIWEASGSNRRPTGLRVKIPDCSQSVSAFYVQLSNSFGFSTKENIHQLPCYEMMLVKPHHKFQVLYSFSGLPFSLLPVWISPQTLGCKCFMTFSSPSSIKIDSRPHLSGGQEIQHQQFVSSTPLQVWEHCGPYTVQMEDPSWLSPGTGIAAVLHAASWCHKERQSSMAAAQCCQPHCCDAPRPSSYARLVCCTPSVICSTRSAQLMAHKLL